MRVTSIVCLVYFLLSGFIYATQLRDLEEMFVLKKSGTYVRNTSELLEKVNKMIHMGADHLLIVTDHDRTMTIDPAPDNGTKVINSFATLRLCPSIPQPFKDEDEKLFKMYWPIVTNPNLTIEDQSKYMIEWYNTRVNLLKGAKLPRNELNNVARNSTLVTLRAGVNELISWSKLNKVPVIVLSAGLGEAVEAVLYVNDLLLPNVKVLSNFFELDNEGSITGWKGTVIHHHNKNKVIQKSEYSETFKGRSNVILMGDELWDANMTESIDVDNRIKIGFLNSAKLNSLQKYIDTFDIVSVNDQTMDIINAILNLIG